MKNFISNIVFRISYGIVILINIDNGVSGVTLGTIKIIMNTFKNYIMLTESDYESISREIGCTVSELHDILDEKTIKDWGDSNPFLSKAPVKITGKRFVKREYLVVPSKVRYLSEWSDFSIRAGHYILDKKLPGCGFTEYALTCELPVVLCSPRKILLQNKKDKHGSKVHLFKNDLDRDILNRELVYSSGLLGSVGELKDTALRVRALKLLVRDYLDDCRSSGNYPKIMVTYDSFRHIKSVLSDLGLLQDFYVVVDEFQCIFGDSRFKGGTEYNFISSLSDCPNVCYVSATPMMDDYLALLPGFSELPYQVLDWKKKDPGRISRPYLEVSTIRSIVPKALKIIESYKKGDFELGKIPGTEKWIPSKEAVLYVNSVSTIISIIKKSGLGPEEVNILCADTKINRRDIKKELGPEWSIGRVPLESEPHKMITICTRTVYLGADFMSTCARTFIFSDANIDSLAVDISLDLPQILGRQRLECNPFRGRAHFYYKPLGKIMEDKEEFDRIVNRKIEATNQILKWYSAGDGVGVPVDIRQEVLSNAMRVDLFDNFYLSFDKDNNNSPVFNKLVMISERRAFDIQKIDYADRFTVYSRIGETGSIITSEMTKFVHEVLRNKGIFKNKRLKLLCETNKFTTEQKRVMASQAGEWVDRYYNGAGPERCKALSYNTTRIDNEILNTLISERQDLREDILETFIVGESYSVKSIKEQLIDMYASYGRPGKAKATDLRKYFELNEKGKVRDPETGDWVSSFKILRKLENNNNDERDS